MLRESRLRLWVLTLLCVLLPVRVDGAHLHLCFDGKEPPASFHLPDLGLHSGAPGVSAPHQDTDVVLAAEALFKPGKSSFDFPPVLLAALVLWALRLAPRCFAAAPKVPATPAASRFLLPPSRGPPSMTSL